MRQDISRQIARERDGIERGRQRFFDQIKGRELESEAANSVVRSAVYALASSIEQLKTEAKRDLRKAGPVAWQRHLLVLPADTMAYITVKTAMTAKALGWAPLSERVGRFCNLESRWRALRAAEAKRDKDATEPAYNRVQAYKRHVKAVDQAAVRKWLRRMEDIETEEWPIVEQRHVGVALLKRLLESCPQFEEYETVRVMRGIPLKIRQIRLTDETWRLIDESADACADLHPWMEPMICQPRDWTLGSREKWTGGYWIVAEDKLFKTAAYQHTAESDHPVPQIVVDSLNRVQRTAWRIDTEVLHVLRKAWEKGIEAVLPVSPTEEVPPMVDDKLWEGMTRDEKKQVWEQRRRVYDSNHSKASKRDVLRRQMAIANDLSGEPAIYFPHNLDWRGRAYPLPQDLHPQADDVARGLLQFADAKPLGPNGIEWLAYQVANSYGLDKAGREEQLAWVQEHLDDLHAVAVDPCGEGLEFWSQADEPWQFLAAALEIEEAFNWPKGPEHFLSRLPVNVDGSCNGLQHLSAMGLDQVGARATNLTADPERQDIYQIVADKVLENLDPERWVYDVTRATVKRGTMTIPYGLTRIGMRDQLIEDGWTDSKKEAAYLRDLMYDAIEDTVAGATDIMDWMRANAEILARHGLPVEWETPTGLMIRQAYWKPRLRVLSTTMGQTKVRRRVNYAEPGDSELQVNKQISGIVPNIIHSFDAAHMMLSVYHAPESISAFSVIHDSFGTHACDMPAFLRVIQEQFVEIYRQDWFAKLQRDFETSRLTQDFPLVVPPYKGSFDIEEVLQSDFFFA